MFIQFVTISILSFSIGILAMFLYIKQTKHIEHIDHTEHTDQPIKYEQVNEIIDTKLAKEFEKLIKQNYNAVLTQNISKTKIQHILENIKTREQADKVAYQNYKFIIYKKSLN